VRVYVALSVVAHRVDAAAPHTRIRTLIVYAPVHQRPLLCVVHASARVAAVTAAANQFHLSSTDARDRRRRRQHSVVRTTIISHTLVLIRTRTRHLRLSKTSTIDSERLVFCLVSTTPVSLAPSTQHKHTHETRRLTTSVAALSTLHHHHTSGSHESLSTTLTHTHTLTSMFHTSQTTSIPGGISFRRICSFSFTTRLRGRTAAAVAGFDYYNNAHAHTHINYLLSLKTLTGGISFRRICSFSSTILRIVTSSPSDCCSCGPT
jgi:hypothetical protein